MKFLQLLLFFSVIISYSQNVTIDDSSTSATELVSTLLNDACIDISNASMSSPLSVANFNNNGGLFPISEGVLIRNGNASYSQGPYSGNNLSSQINENSDAFLQNLVQNSGQNTSITDVAYLEFNFTPLSNNLSFNFLFASNEYGEWQCASNDAIAFILTNLDTGEVKNLAIIPESTIPISVKNIRDNTYNSSCTSENPSLFESYMVSNPDNSNLNMRGYTVLLNAFATLVPGDAYKLKFVVGDAEDSEYDSAIFLEAGSFNTSIDLGEDKKLCPDETVTLDTNLDPNIYDHTWLMNGEIIPNENSSSLLVDEGGTYSVILSNNEGNCEVSDEIIFSEFNIAEPTDLNLCYTTEGYVVNLDSRIYWMLINEVVENFEWKFYTSAEDANNAENAIQAPLSYIIFPDFSSRTIWIRLHSTDGSNCTLIYSFTIYENPPPEVPDIESVVRCSSYTLPEVPTGTYRTADGDELNAGDVIDDSGTYYLIVGPDENGCSNQVDFQVTLIDEYQLPDHSCGEYIIPQPPIGAFYTQADGPNGNGTEIPTGTTIEETQTIYYYAEIDGVICQNNAYTIEIYPLPDVDDLENIVSCEPYTLPELNNGEYYTFPDGEGTNLEAGTIIYNTKYLFIYINDGTCSNQTSFIVRIVPDMEDVTACGSYTLPFLQNGVEYRTSPNGEGEIIEEETVLTNSQTIYIYANSPTEPNCTDNLSFDVTIKELPLVDQLPDVSLQCEEDFYILPELQNGNYSSESTPNPTSSMNVGDIITEPQTIYIYRIVDGCINISSFEITYDPIPNIENFADVYTCEPYILPELPFGNFYTEPGGNGDILNAGDSITENKTLYIYYQPDENSLCIQEKMFAVYVIGVEVDVLENVKACDSYVLPTLTNGNYFTEPEGEGISLSSGDIIEESQTIYIYAKNGDRLICEDESSFIVTITNTPDLSNIQDIEECGEYSLPNLSNSNYTVKYYKDSNQENLIPESEYNITEPDNHSIYIYAEANNNPNCNSQKKIQVLIHPLLNLQINGGTICVDSKTGEPLSEVELNSFLDPELFKVNWFLKGNLIHSGPNLVTNEAGTYTVETEKLTEEIGDDCNYKPTTVVVHQSSKPIISIKQTEDFVNTAIITITVHNKVGEYLYKIDDKPYQENNSFYNVESGIHKIAVKGVNGECGVTTAEVLTLKYPKYFTPNDDGVNDYWNIKDLKLNKEAIIFIHDRFGKLLTSFPPQEKGWDGNYNGSKMPSNDYWFRVTYEIDGEPREFVSHFTLLR